jgi:hypothetical protein
VRTLVLASGCGLALLLAPRDAEACFCRGNTFAWPSGVKEVPHTSHILIVGAAGEVLLQDVGSAPTDDPIAAQLVSPGQLRRLFKWPGSPFPVDLRPGGVPVEVERRPMSGQDFPAIELVPRRPLARRHRFVIVDRRDGNERPVIGVFETGDQVDGSATRPPELELQDVQPTDPHAVGSMCQTGSGTARFKERSARMSTVLLGVWTGDLGSPRPDGFVLLQRGEFWLGRADLCSRLGVPLGAGGHRVAFREWGFAGFGPPTTVAFDL